MASESVFRSLDAFDCEVCVESRGRSIAKFGVEGWAGVVVEVMRDRETGNLSVVRRETGTS